MKTVLVLEQKGWDLEVEKLVKLPFLGALVDTKKWCVFLACAVLLFFCSRRVERPSKKCVAPQGALAACTSLTAHRKKKRKNCAQFVWGLYSAKFAHNIILHSEAQTLNYRNKTGHAD